MAVWIMHCHLGRRRVNLPDPPTREAVVEVLERVAPRPGWANEAAVTALPTWDAPTTLRCDTVHGLPMATFKRSQARTVETKVSIYLAPAVRDQLRAAADAAGVTVSTLGGRLIADGLDRAIVTEATATGATQRPARPAAARGGSR